jgi:hypothetical protein
MPLCHDNRQSELMFDSCMMSVCTTCYGLTGPSSGTSVCKCIENIATCKTKKFITKYYISLFYIKIPPLFCVFCLKSNENLFCTGWSLILSEELRLVERKV